MAILFLPTSLQSTRNVEQSSGVSSSTENKNFMSLGLIV